ncbi:carbon-monoxide dehydrogenase medium subunit [Monaibacterium marinum]|uniref:Carbon-monoxide dehydrogenase medium subunit n=2 Tax=Pontivivens marinum TaxID=1690039 RepID=A0A2C9CUP5_9RHOB|nr:carbon-monoxide dehydrogenase medium subunit [Monaibacterium marinum]
MILQNAQGDARIIAGGQSLMPMLNFRLATPTLLVDLNRIAALSGIGMTDEGLRIGAMTRTRDIETSALIAQHQPLIAHAVPHIAHLPIRSRGTIGGSLSHADPAAEFPALMLAVDAQMVLHGPQGARVVPAGEYFQGLFETATKSAEILTHIDLPHWPEARRFGFQEYSRRRGDFALAGIAFWADMDGDICGECRVVAFGVSDRPVRLHGVEQILQSHPLNDADAMLQARDAVDDLLEPDSDLQASAEYRRMLAAELLQRAVHAAGGMA